MKKHEGRTLISPRGWHPTPESNQCPGGCPFKSKNYMNVIVICGVWYVVCGVSDCLDSNFHLATPG